MFDNLRNILRERTEKNAVKSQLTWTDRKGNEHSDIVYLKKSSLPLIGDWGRIYPVVDENNKINIINLIFGGKKNFMKLILLFLLLSLAYYEFNNLLGDSKEFMNGDKYVIIAKDVFDKFCQKSIMDGSGSWTYDNSVNLSNIIIGYEE